jgi:S-adenosylmethionine:tRNA ribosyltransferase-isomerase
MDPRNIGIKDYSYFLPEEKIAKHPLAERDASRLLVFNHGNVQQDIYRNIANYLPANSLMLFNNTRVIEARLLFQKVTGGIIEIFCLEPADENTDAHTAMTQTESVLWKCLIGGASKWKPGLLLEKKIKHVSTDIKLSARIRDRQTDTFLIELTWSPGEFTFAEVLHYAGAIPLPPYIKRKVEESDAERYQTIYAREAGSVAAPTAGLHFTPFIFSSLAEKNIVAKYVTLHVGAGTFKPVKAELMLDHEMHAEYFEVDEDLIRSLMENELITAVGTTTARTIETLYWLGVKAQLNSSMSPHELGLEQWEAYELTGDLSKLESMQALIHWMHVYGQEKILTKTKLLIAPGYKWRVVKQLVTNFHQPQSTLLLLVAAAAGRDWKKMYDYALTHDFRFLSYGDGCLLFVE